MSNLSLQSEYRVLISALKNTISIEGLLSRTPQRMRYSNSYDVRQMPGRRASFSPMVT